MATATEKKDAKKPDEKAPESKADDKKPTIMRSLTDAEMAEMSAEENNAPPADYANITPGAKEEETPAVEAKPGDEKKAPAEKGKADETKKPGEEEAGDKKPGDEKGKAVDTFDKLETWSIEAEKLGIKDEAALRKFIKTKESDSTPRERAYFAKMFYERKKRQEVESERDVLRRNELKLKKDLEKRPPAPEVDPFEGKSEDDVLSVKEARELYKKNKPKPEEAEKAPDAAPANARAMRYLKMCETEARAANADFDVVMELSDDLIANNPEALREIARRTEEGDNPALVMYDVIKKQPDFETLLPAAETRFKARASGSEEKKDPPAKAAASAAAAEPTAEEKAKLEKAKQAERAFEENGQRPKTTAHVSSREGKPADELTFEELASMPDAEFAKLPRHVRQRYLRKMG